MNEEVLNVGQLQIRYLVDGAKSGGLGLFEMTVPPGAPVPPPHSHSYNEECVYVLEGELRYTVNDHSRDLHAGEWMSTPCGAVHAFSNLGKELARVLVMLTPDIGAQFFRDIGSVVNTDAPPDRSKLLDIMTQYGLVPAAPQPSQHVANS